MQRRKFLRNIAGAATVTAILPTACAPVDQKEGSVLSDRSEDNWESLGTGQSEIPTRRETLDFEVVVIGAGMAGIPAAVASARQGAKTVLVNDRPMLGGNASSEIRVTVNGVNNLISTKLPERETGIIEEILIENRAYNQQESYPVWDHVLYDFVTREPNLTVLLNTQAIDAIKEGDRIISARCWQSTTETEFLLNGKVFLDCSGDGLMAAKAGALYRTGREGREEYGEEFAPEVADGWQMGASILMQAKDMGRPMPYKAPAFAIPYKPNKGEDKHRKIKQYVDGFWWVELGSDFDIIADREKNRHRLMGYLHGVWDYVKNSGDHPDSANYALTWVGNFPGRRESRRFIGDHVLSETDMTEYRQFPDAIGYGGWSLDEHNPGGIERMDLPPSFFHKKFRELYEVPFRSLYSKNIDNLMFAGRNASLTHIALSSTRIQGTCALMGQAIGTAATMCVRKDVTPRQIGKEHIAELQERLIRDDVFIPNRPANDPNDLAKTADKVFASSTQSGDVNLLFNGVSRDLLYKKEKEINHWQSEGLPARVQLEWENPVALSTIEIKCDTNLQRKIMMRKQPTLKHHTTAIPPELIKTLEVEARIQGTWTKVAAKTDNLTRLIRLPFASQEVTAVRINVSETYGHAAAKLFEIRCYA